MIRRPPRSTPLYSSAASDVYKRQLLYRIVVHKFHIAIEAAGDHCFVHPFTSIQRFYEHIANTASHPFLFIPQGQRRYCPALFGRKKIPDGIQEKEDVSIAHVERQDVNLRNVK